MGQAVECSAMENLCISMDLAKGRRGLFLWTPQISGQCLVLLLTIAFVFMFCVASVDMRRWEMWFFYGSHNLYKNFET